MSERDKDDLGLDLQELGREAFPSTICELAEVCRHNKMIRNHDQPIDSLSTKYSRSWVRACKNFQIALQDRCEYRVQIVLKDLYA